MTLKNGFGKCSLNYLFCVSQWMKRSKHGFFGFPPKKTLIWRRHCSIGQSCCSKTSKRSIDWFLESSSCMKFFQLSVRLTNHKPQAFVSVRQNQSNRSVSFSLLFLFSGHTKIAPTTQNMKIKEHKNQSKYRRRNGWTILKRIETRPYCNRAFWKLVSLTVFQSSFLLFQGIVWYTTWETFSVFDT